MLKNYQTMQRITKAISELWCKRFGTLKYFSQRILVFEDESIVIEMNFNPEVLIPSYYDEFINEVEELIIKNKLNYELLKDDTNLIVEI